MSRRFPKTIWILRHETLPLTQGAEVLGSKARANLYREMPGWQVVEYQRVEGQQVPKRNRSGS